MQNFSITYNFNVEDPFNPEFGCFYDFNEGMFDEHKIDDYDIDTCLSYVKEIKAIIKRDMKRILDYRVKYLNNSKSLVRELNTLIETIDNGQEYDFWRGNKFFFLTDNYLCFNNFEDFIDELG